MDKAPAWDADGGATAAAVKWLEANRKRQFDSVAMALASDWMLDQLAIRSVDEKILWIVTWNHLDMALVERRMSQGKAKRLIDVVLTSARDQLSDEHIRYLEALSETPMRLYQVSRVNPGKSLMLVDMVADDNRPIMVLDRVLSTSMSGGEVLGARVVDLSTHKVLARGFWPMDIRHVGALMNPLEQTLSAAPPEEAAERRRRGSLAHVIAAFWLDGICHGTPISVVDAKTGEPLKLVTDEYEVADFGALERALSGQQGVARTGPKEWMAERSIGEKRYSISLYEDAKSGKFCVFYLSQVTAAHGRQWFDGVAGSSVRHVGRHVTSPSDIEEEFRKDPKAAEAAVRANHQLLPPEQMTQAVQAMYEQTYRDWADRPVPILHNMTPRQACATPGGQEKVRALLRSFETNELGFAQFAHRKPASLQFLWDAVGLAR